MVTIDKILTNIMKYRLIAAASQETSGRVGDTGA